MTELDESGIYSLTSAIKPSSALPITNHRRSILYCVESTQICIIVGHTGSGKSTQVPQYLFQAGWAEGGKQIAVTQPRRVAVTTIAIRIAQEVGCDVGQEVGYSIRFEDMTSSKTRIKIMTDGLLLREALVDPLLSNYSVIMIDEVHERSVTSDICLGVLKKILKRRSDLRLVVSSATLDAEALLDYFVRDHSQGRIINLEGRSFPIDIHHTEQSVDDYVEKAVNTAFEIHNKEKEGDILVFLSGRQEIDRAVQIMIDRGNQALQPLPLYAGLTIADQRHVFNPSPEGIRKVIFSTNVAEASVTIDGIGYVVDSGFVKQRYFDSLHNGDRLLTVPISKSSATQRAGRCGRTRPGKCYRLYTELAFNDLLDASVPELQRCDLAPIVLQLKALGIDNIAQFGFLTPPPANHLAHALDVLHKLKALDDFAKLTKPIGLQMAEFALDPISAALLLSSPSFGCSSEILSIIAMSGLEVFTDMKERLKFAAEEGDHLTMLNVYNSYKGEKWCYKHHINFKTMKQAISTRRQLQRQMEKFGHLEASGSSDTVLTCLRTGLVLNSATLQSDGSYRTKQGYVFKIHMNSILFNREVKKICFTSPREVSVDAYRFA